MIDDSFKRPWPDEVIQATAQFKQGDLIERPPFTYQAVPRYQVWGLSNIPDDASNELEPIELEPDNYPPYGLITTQTCDVDEQGRKRRKPWFQVAPVYRADLLDKGDRLTIERHMVNHLVALHSATLPEGFWVADLRIEFPMEKSALVGRVPIESFTNEDEYLKLADRLAEARRRPALDNSTSIYVVGPLKEHCESLKKSRRPTFLDPVYELRLAIRGTRLNVSAARLIVILKQYPYAQEVVDFFDEWWQKTSPGALTAGIDLLPNRYTTLGRIRGIVLVKSVPLAFGHLSPND